MIGKSPWHALRRRMKSGLISRELEDGEEAASAVLAVMMEVYPTGLKAMTEPAKVFEDHEIPGQWRVEWVADDGVCELVDIFTGPDAHRQALRYAMQKYGLFKEVQSMGEIAPPR
jgi:hypothetical protein